MSHEIRTPLHAILGFSELLGKTIKDNKEMNYIESIKNSSKTLLTLINDILDLSKIEAGKITFNYHFIDAFSFFTEIAGIFSFKANEKGLEFIIDISPSVPVTIYIDDLRLRQILINLIGNAIKFTEKGFVKLLINVSELSKEKRNDENIECVDMIFEVHDTGIGISKEFQKRIFQTFTQYEHKSQKKYEGTGLGLSISKRLAEMMNGSISFESVEGQGSIFFVTLHKVQFIRDKLSKEEKHISYEKILFKGSKLLIVDDIESNRQFIISELKDKNLNLYEAGDGKECIELIKKIIPDLIITDLNMPGMDGFKLLKALKKDPVLAQIPVIATTATYADTPELRKKYPFHSIIFKPVQHDILLDELMKYLPFSSESSESQEIKNLTVTDSNKLSKKDFDQIKNIIDSELLPMWNDLKEQQPLEEVEKFGKRIIEIGEQNKIGIFYDYATKLLNALSNFDIDNMLKLISGFPEIIKELEKTIKED